MKKFLFIVSMLALFVPVIASAHQHASFTVGSVQYDIVIGSLNEPVAVDDKTGVDLTVSSGGHMATAADGDMEPQGGKPATGLEQTLQVELISGDKKKTLDLSPAYGKPGSYTAAYYPTTADPLSYRLFGTLNNIAIDVTFACLPHGATALEEGQKNLSAGVVQLNKTGGFGCPSSKDELGFPERSASINSLASSEGSDRTYAYAAVALAAVAFVFAVMRRKS